MANLNNTAVIYSTHVSTHPPGIIVSDGWFTVERLVFLALAYGRFPTLPTLPHVP